MRVSMIGISLNLRYLLEYANAKNTKRADNIMCSMLKLIAVIIKNNIGKTKSHFLRLGSSEFLSNAPWTPPFLGFFLSDLRSYKSFIP